MGRPIDPRPASTEPPYPPVPPSGEYRYWADRLQEIVPAGIWDAVYNIVRDALDEEQQNAYREMSERD